MGLTKESVKLMRDHASDFVEEVEELAEEWLQMKKVLTWIQQNSNEEKVKDYLKENL